MGCHLDGEEAQAAAEVAAGAGKTGTQTVIAPVTEIVIVIVTGTGTGTVIVGGIGCTVGKTKGGDSLGASCWGLAGRQVGRPLAHPFTGTGIGTWTMIGRGLGTGTGIETGTGTETGTVIEQAGRQRGIEVETET
jgi:hypothetical protein